MVLFFSFSLHMHFIPSHIVSLSRSLARSWLLFLLQQGSVVRIQLFRHFDLLVLVLLLAFLVLLLLDALFPVDDLRFLHHGHHGSPKFPTKGSERFRVVQKRKHHMPKTPSPPCHESLPKQGGHLQNSMRRTTAQATGVT